MRQYMSIVLPAAKHYGIEELSSWKQPGIGADWDLYHAFFADVDFCITALRLRNIEQISAHSVALSADTKTKLRQMLEHVRQTVEKLDISVAQEGGDVQAHQQPPGRNSIGGARAGKPSPR